MKRLTLTIWCCVLLCVCGGRALAQDAMQLRLPVIVNMMVFDKVKTLTIKVDGEYCIFNQAGKIISAGSGLHKTKIIARIDEFFLSNRMIGERKLLIKTYGGAHIYLNGSPYTDSMEFSINGKGSFSVLNRVKLEKYLVGVLAGEIDDDTPIEAMKAQAIISRTFAIFSLLKNPESVYQMTVRNPQVYRPILFQSSNYSKAVKETEGIILTFNGCVFPTYFSSVCGGQTEFSGNVWQLDFDLPATIKCPYCKQSPQYRWDLSLSVVELKRLLVKNGLKIGTIYSLEPKKKSAVSDRVTEVIVKHSKGISYVRTNWLRGMLGNDRLRSTSFTMKVDDGKVTFSGRGWGHGVGLCQDGAAKMAAEGYSYQDILRFYYPGTEIKRISWSLEGAAETVREAVEKTGETAVGALKEGGTIVEGAGKTTGEVADGAAKTTVEVGKGAADSTGRMVTGAGETTKKILDHAGKKDTTAEDSNRMMKKQNKKPGVRSTPPQ